MKRIIKTVSALLFPPRCSACREILPYYDERVLCDNCAEKWESEINAYCKICHKKVFECTCIHDNCKRTVKRLLSVSAYTAADSVTDHLVLSAKDIRDEKLFEFMAHKMVGAVYSELSSLGDIVVTFVPRSKRRKRSVGHDQSEILAKKIADELGETSFDLLSKKGRVQQKKLDVTGRESNARESYILRDGAHDKVKGKTVILVDDVVTSGASLSTCAALLKDAGADEIYALTFAKTVKRR